MGEERSDGDERGGEDGLTLGERGSMSIRPRERRMAAWRNSKRTTHLPCPPMTILLPIPLAHHGTSSNLSTPS